MFTNIIGVPSKNIQIETTLTLYYVAKTLSYIFVDRIMCVLYNRANKGRDPFVRKL